MTTLQHLLGLATGGLLFLAARRLGASRPVAFVPAAVVLLNGDQLFLEHTLLSDALFAFVATAALYACVRCVDAGSRGWLVALGALLGTGVLVRNVGLILVPMAVLWLLAVRLGRPRRRLAESAAVVLIVVALMAADATLREATTDYEGWSPVSGWTLYARVGQFADCERFDPPSRSAALCERTAPQERKGPTWYAASPDAPAKRSFGVPPNGNDVLEAFARAAIVHQPLDYLRTVGTDLARNVHPRLSEREFAGLGPEALAFVQPANADKDLAEASMEPYYGEVSLRERTGARALDTYQSVFRVHGPLLALGFALAAAGIVLGRGDVRRGAALFGGCAFLLILFPAAILTYNPRYSVPPTGPLALAAALGTSVLIARARERRARRASAGVHG